eukprot:10450692-Alexandrium_andersonii.AAC.1
MHRKARDLDKGDTVDQGARQVGHVPEGPRAPAGQPLTDAGCPGSGAREPPGRVPRARADLAITR